LTKGRPRRLLDGDVDVAKLLSLAVPAFTLFFDEIENGAPTPPPSGTR
jgi:hypothetical protein